MKRSFYVLVIMASLSVPFVSQCMDDKDWIATGTGGGTSTGNDTTGSTGGSDDTTKDN